MALRGRQRVATPAALLAGLAIVVGCSRSERPEPSEPEEAEAGDIAELPPPRSYTARGQVTSVPTPDDPASRLSIHHEAIDDFVGRFGSVGMNSMEMEFPLGEGVSLVGIEPGDKVEFTFQVDWSSTPAYHVTAIRELPADTPLEFRKAQPPGG